LPWHAERFRMDLDSVSFTGASGASYAYYVPREGRSWLPEPANFLFARSTPRGWRIYFVGEADNLAQALTGHERWREAVQSYGVTHALTHLSAADGVARRREAADLIAAYSPAMNAPRRPIQPMRLEVPEEARLDHAGAGRQRDR
jgi:hypothetical protein